MAHDVFISYAAKDKSVADAACATLEARKLRCWIAPRDVLPGLNYAEVIVDAINDSRVMLLIFSSQSNASPQVMREVERAVSRGLAIIPFRIEDTIPSKAMEYFISAPHWLDALTPPLEKHLARLADTAEFLVRQSAKTSDPARESPTRSPSASSSNLASAAPAATGSADLARPPSAANPASAPRAASPTQSSGSVDRVRDRVGDRVADRAGDPAGNPVRDPKSAPKPSGASRAANAARVEPAGATSPAHSTARSDPRPSRSWTYVLSAAALLVAGLTIYFLRGSSVKPVEATETAAPPSLGAPTPPAASGASEDTAHALSAVAPATSAEIDAAKTVSIASKPSDPTATSALPPLSASARAFEWPGAKDLEPNAAIWSGSWREGDRASAFLLELPPNFSSATIASAHDAPFHARAACFPEFACGVSIEGRTTGKSVTWTGPAIEPGEDPLHLSSTLDGGVLTGTWTRGARSGSFETSLDTGRTDLLRSGNVWTGRMTQAGAARECVLVVRAQDRRRIGGDLFLLERGPATHAFEGFVAADNVWCSIDANASELAGRAIELKLQGEHLHGLWTDRQGSGDIDLDLDREMPPPVTPGSVWKGTYQAEGKASHILLKIDKVNAESIGGQLYFPEDSSTPTSVNGRLMGDRMLLAAEAGGELKKASAFAGVLSKSGINGRWLPGGTEHTAQFTPDYYRAGNFEIDSSWKGRVHTTGKIMPATLQVKNRKNAVISAVIEFDGKGPKQTKSVNLEGMLVGSTLAMVMSASGTDWDGARVWAEVKPRWVIGKWVTKGSEGDLSFELQQ
jgi:hypothetical protein